MFIGADPMAVLIYELCFSFFVLFKHAKINIYPRLENLLNKLIVTPALHRQHHSDRLDYQNANYGVCLIVWDRMFNTFKLRTLNESHLEYGLEGFFNKKARQAISLMMFPFKSKKLKDKPNNYYPKRRSGDIPSERINE